MIFQDRYYYTDPPPSHLHNHAAGKLEGLVRATFTVGVNPGSVTLGEWYLFDELLLFPRAFQEAETKRLLSGRKSLCYGVRYFGERPTSRYTIS